MKALGYSTQEVDGSMQKLTKGIDGLPTSLDEIVSNTQQLAISTGSLNKGTDTALALNNAFLASGASTADVKPRNATISTNVSKRYSRYAVVANITRNYADCNG